MIPSCRTRRPFAAQNEISGEQLIHDIEGGGGMPPAGGPQGFFRKHRAAMIVLQWLL